MTFWIKSAATGAYIDADHPDPNRPVTQILYVPALCLLCPNPATTLDDYCDACAGAIQAPDPLCASCGEPLGEADIAAGEVTCAGCGDGEEVERGRKA